MDGVLIDSEPAMAQAAAEGMADYGITVSPEEFKPFCGTDDQTYFGSVAQMHGGTYSEELGKHIYDLYCERASQYILPCEGVPDTVLMIRRHGYKTALASSAGRRKLTVNIAASRVPPDCFDGIISGSDVSKRKPDPEIFLTAAAAIALPPEHCLVIEDAVSGVKAAKAAGMRCFAVTSTFSEETLRDAGADDCGGCVRDVLPYLIK